jgi:transcription initiation factor TFIIIB Brf1 subunit/transcription initiation factor TFIIB
MKCCGVYIIYDRVSGINVCTLCSKIYDKFENLYEVDYELIPKNDFIETICANNHLCKSIEDEALYKFSKSKKKSIPFAAYCIYIACKTQDVPRTFNEIAVMCFLSPNLISAFEKNTDLEIQPSKLSSRFCASLGFKDFQFEKSAGQLADHLYNCLLLNSPAQSAMALAIYVLAKTEKKNVALLSIAKACLVTTSCIRRLFKIYKKEIDLILPLYVKHVSTSQLASLNLQKSFFYKCAG